MPRHDDEFALVLNSRVRIGRRSGFTKTAMGQRRPSGESTIATISVLFDYNPKGYVWVPPGQMQKVDYFMFAKYDEDVQTGDMVYPVSGIVGMTIGRIMNVMPIPDLDGATHHIEALIERIA